MSGQMCWLFSSDNKDHMILHLRKLSFDPWLPYTTFPQYAVPDYPIPRGSKGWSTYQKLRQSGWSLIATDQVLNPFVRPEVQRI